MNGIFPSVTAALLVYTMLAALGASRVPSTPVGLSWDSRAELALARARGDARVTLVIAARPGRLAALLDAIAAAGGTIGYRRDDLGYLRIEVPLAAVETIADLEAIEAVAIDVPARTRRSPDTGQLNALPGGQDPPSRWPLDPFTRPYHPLADLGARTWRDQHPSYDGRGVTVAHVEAGLDLTLPEFATAYTINGEPVAKVIDLRTSMDPRHVHEGARRTPWVNMQTVVAGSAQADTTDGAYTLPHPGHYRFGLFDAHAICASGAACRFGVLWDAGRGEVWVDTNHDRSFADEAAMTDFARHRDIGSLHLPGATSTPGTMAFTVQIDKAQGFVALNLGDNGHSTMVASSAAASRGDRGRIEGIAPGARLLEIDYGFDCIAGAIEGLIDAFTDARSDIVLFEQTMGLARPYRLGDGRFPMTVITNRLVTKYQKPFVVPAGNYMGLDQSSEHGNVAWGFSVGAFETKASYAINDGYVVAHDVMLHHAGAWGPNGMGAVKPDILAPSGYLVAERDPTGGGAIGLFRLPPGYSIGAGTSQAAPTLAGALAVLISAARQEQVPVDPERIWRAVVDSARFVGHLPAHEQGNGLVDVAAAFELLKTFANHAPQLEIVSRAPVRTAYSAWLPTPHQGVGLWEREGWSAGQRQTRTITLTRRTGVAGAMTFAVSWQSNDGTFESASTVTLPLGAPVDLPVSISPQTEGVHSALLTLDHAAVPGHAFRTMATIVVGRACETNTTGACTMTGLIERPGPASLYVNMPAAAEAFALQSDVSLGLFDPMGLDLWLAASARRMMSLPQPGTWEIAARMPEDRLDLAWAARSEHDVAPPVPYSVKVTPLAATVDAPPSLPLNVGASKTVTITVANTLAAFTGGVTPMALGSQHRTRLVSHPRQQHLVPIQVPAASPILLVEARSRTTSAGEDEIDLYLFDCTSAPCVRVAAAPGRAGVARLRQLAPKPGLWKIVVDTHRTAAPSVAIDYVDVVGDPALGSVTVSDGLRPRPVGAQWTNTANVWFAKAPTDHRTATALFVVQATDAGGTVPIAIRTMDIEPDLTAPKPQATDASHP